MKLLQQAIKNQYDSFVEQRRSGEINFLLFFEVLSQTEALLSVAESKTTNPAEKKEQHELLKQYYLEKDKRQKAFIKLKRIIDQKKKIIIRTYSMQIKLSQEEEKYMPKKFMGGKYRVMVQE